MLQINFLFLEIKRKEKYLYVLYLGENMFFYGHSRIILLGSSYRDPKTLV